MTDLLRPTGRTTGPSTRPSGQASRPPGPATRPPGPVARRPSAARGPIVVQAAAAAASVAATGLLAATVVVLLAWLADPRTGADTASAFRAASRLWLVAHHVGLRIGPGRLDLAPLGLSLVAAGFLLRSAALLAPAHAVRTPRAAVRLTVLLAVPYAGIAALVAPLASAGPVRVAPGSAAAGTGVLAVLAGGLGVLLGSRPGGSDPADPATRPVDLRVPRRRWSGSRRAPRVGVPRSTAPGRPARWKAALRRYRRPRLALPDLRLPGSGRLAAAVDRLLPARTRPVVEATAVAVGALLAAGGLLAVASFGWHAPRAVALGRAVEPGLVGGAALFLLCAALVPNAAVWGAAYLAGPGFAVGTGTAVRPFGGSLGPVPALPLLAALPERPPPLWMAVPMVLIPVGAGALAGSVLVHRLPAARPRAPRDTVRRAAGCGIGAGAVLALVAWLSGGAAGPGRLAVVGPSPWRVGLAVALEVTVGVAIGLTLAHRRSVATE